jgi:hypothetical protein
MLFAALSIEFDTRIISFMDHHSLDSMSRSSRHYRHIAEPFLYRHLEFANLDDIAIRRLCLTLFARRELAGHDKSFAVEPANWHRTREVDNI